MSLTEQEKIVVSLADGRKLLMPIGGPVATITDLAVVRIANAKNLITTQLGDSTILQVGEPAAEVAMGVAWRARICALRDHRCCFGNEQDLA